jgi:hypothetical protein
MNDKPEQGIDACVKKVYSVVWPGNSCYGFFVRVTEYMP